MMNLNPDSFPMADRPASDQQKIDALKLIWAAWPQQRESADAELQLKAFAIALGDVGEWALDVATKAILRGALRHGFAPSPPEYRMVIDAVERERIGHFEAEAALRRIEADRIAREEDDARKAAAAAEAAANRPPQRLRRSPMEEHWLARKAKGELTAEEEAWLNKWVPIWDAERAEKAKRGPSQWT